LTRTFRSAGPLRLSGITSARFERRRAGLTRAARCPAHAFPSEFDTTRQIAARLADLYLYGLPDSFYDDCTDAIMKTRVEEVGGAASAIDAGRLVIVLIGDAAAVGDRIRALGLGDVRTVTITDVLGEPSKI
jgi:hypothetical protein